MQFFRYYNHSCRWFLDIIHAFILFRDSPYSFLEKSHELSRERKNGKSGTVELRRKNTDASRLYFGSGVYLNMNKPCLHSCSFMLMSSILYSSTFSFTAKYAKSYNMLFYHKYCGRTKKLFSALSLIHLHQEKKLLVLHFIFLWMIFDLILWGLDLVNRIGFLTLIAFILL